jgi:coiled-coil domain-containing protein 55
MSDSSFYTISARNTAAGGFSGFAIAKKPSSKPVQQSSLAGTSKLGAPKPIERNEDRHEAFKRTTEAAQVSLKKEDIESMNKALEEDPTAFDYDDVYEEMQPTLSTKKKHVTGNARFGYGITVSESKSKASSESQPQSRYIDSLLSKAREREVERSMAQERQIHRENMKYEEQFGATESFVTPEYLAKMEEDRKRLEELDARDRQESSPGNFYSNMRRATLGGPSVPDLNPAAPSSSSTQVSHSVPSRPSPSTLPSTSDSHRNNERTSQDQHDFDTSSLTPSDKLQAPRQSLIAENQRKPRRHTEQMIEEAKKRYQMRKERRTQTGVQAPS